MNSSGFGPVIQHAFFVRDMNAALTYWIEVMGVGPFYKINNATYKKAFYRNAPATPEYSVALAYWGDNQIELVTPTSDNPSIYKEFLDDGHDGLLHHMCVTVKDMNEFRNGIDATKFETLAERSKRVKQTPYLPFYLRITHHLTTRCRFLCARSA